MIPEHVVGYCIQYYKSAIGSRDSNFQVVDCMQFPIFKHNRAVYQYILTDFFDALERKLSIMVQFCV